ncbi:MAG: phosphate signaling complex protein PhoU [Bordetella sp.]|nr:MAG: phosphate signaling complex protein PhoU [Bordetella sp.]
MPKHTNKQFDIDLKHICSQFLQMGEIVKVMIDDAIEALVNRDMNLVNIVRDHEKKVNRYEVEIDEQISYILVRHQPTAIDLRMLLAVSKMLTDMERSGDEAEKVANAAYRIHGIYGSEFYNRVPTTEIRKMAGNARLMLKRTLDAFIRLDPIQAAEVVRSDKEVDKEWKGTLFNLIACMIEDRRAISRATNMIFIARALERIGDHAKNMSERVIYMVKGADVRHTGIKNTERLAREG